MKEIMYVLEQPTHTIATIIVIRGDEDVNEEFYDFIERTRRVSDIFLIFGDNMKEVNYKKFSSLFGANGFVYGGSNTVRSLVFTLTYLREVMINKHLSFLVCSSQDLVDGVPDISDKLENINASSLASIICKTTRLPVVDLRKIYKREPGPDKKWWEIWKKDPSRDSELDTTDMYSRYSLTGRFCFLRVGHVIDLLKLSDDYIDSFSKNRIDLFIGSYAKMSGLRVLDEDIQSMEVGKLWQ